MGKILVSACLLGETVHRDSQQRRLVHPQLEQWRRQGRLVPFCPEVAAGLPVQRPGAEIRQRFPILITDRDGEDLTPAYLHGAELALEVAQREQCCCALLQSLSPSCGPTRVYDGQFQQVPVQGSGITAAELMRHGIPLFDETQLRELFAFMQMQDLSAA
ncbi:DUF523 domain-containing protein [Marinobacterium rhizophilum]|uniref:DUF523 domain-containing protein n=1 Tax=Marinobacterium rhizophilum TaxID=420402 RepID=A0ABY5HM08_9GAMM|nr:DUF523 domain-containing protein [Marinobacterium rhizophilum]UTW13330.1 DUF523 domain-containing protein [Marinobacterium rhizophilum]